MTDNHDGTDHREGRVTSPDLDGGTASLAETAAAWVPPWSREPESEDHTAGPDDGTADGEGAPTGVRPTPGTALGDTTGRSSRELAVDDPTVGTEPVAEAADGTQPVAPVDEPEPMSELDAEIAASWVPPWARAMPDLVIEPASDNPISLDPWWTSMPDQPADGEAAEDEPEPRMPEAELRAALEAILLVVDEPVGEVALAQVLEEPTGRIGTMLQRLADEYAAHPRGYELRHAAGGWRLYTRTEYAPYVERFILDGQSVRLTQAALETLAVVAYKQPVTRSRISAIRGVNCDGVLKTLMGRGLVEEIGAEPESGAYLYRTTPLFLEKLGINSTDELPGLAPFLPDNIDEIDIANR